MIKQDISENRAKFVYLGIGSNLGNKKLNIEKAKFQIEKNNIINNLKEGSDKTTKKINNKINPTINIVLPSIKKYK